MLLKVKLGRSSGLDLQYDTFLPLFFFDISCLFLVYSECKIAPILKYI